MSEFELVADTVAIVVTAVLGWFTLTRFVAAEPGSDADIARLGIAAVIVPVAYLAELALIVIGSRGTNGPMPVLTGILGLFFGASAIGLVAFGNKALPTRLRRAVATKLAFYTVVFVVLAASSVLRLPHIFEIALGVFFTTGVVMKFAPLLRGGARLNGR